MWTINTYLIKQWEIDEIKPQGKHSMIAITVFNFKDIFHFSELPRDLEMSNIDEAYTPEWKNWKFMYLKILS